MRWLYEVIALSVLAPTVFAVSAIVGLTLEVHDRRRPASASRPNRIRGMTRFALFAGAFSIFATFVFGDLPVTDSLLVAAGVAIMLAPGSIVYRWPGRGPVIMWSAWSVLVSILVALLVTLDSDHITISMCFPIAVLMTILVVALPVAALSAARDTTPARAIVRSARDSAPAARSCGAADSAPGSTSAAPRRATRSRCPRAA